jgi:hypothetical protein
MPGSGLAARFALHVLRATDGCSACRDCRAANDWRDVCMELATRARLGRLARLARRAICPRCVKRQEPQSVQPRETPFRIRSPARMVRRPSCEGSFPGFRKHGRFRKASMDGFTASPGKTPRTAACREERSRHRESTRQERSRRHEPKRRHQGQTERKQGKLPCAPQEAQGKPGRGIRPKRPAAPGGRSAPPPTPAPPPAPDWRRSSGRSAATRPPRRAPAP